MHCPTLSELPPPPPGKTGWPWTVESDHLPKLMANGQRWPKISIITPSYNQGPFIEETIRSCLLQGYPEFEYCIIDGGSVDETVSIIKKYALWISYGISEKDEGQGSAINKGSSLVTGDWVNWLNSDDTLTANALSRLAEKVVFSDKPFDVISFTTLVVNETGVPLFPFRAGLVITSPMDFLGKWQMLIPQPSTFMRRNLLRVDESMHCSMDWALYFDLASAGFVFFTSDFVAARFRQHLSSKTHLLSASFESEKISFIQSRIESMPSYGKTMKSWVRDRHLRSELNKKDYSIFDIFLLTIRNPILIKHRMFWGRLKLEIIKKVFLK